MTKVHSKSPARSMWAVVVALSMVGSVGSVRGEDSPAAAQPRAAGLARRGGGQWWNVQDVSTALKLKDEQRAQMDERWSRFTQEQAVDQRGEVEARKKFEERLAAGDWTAARAAVAERARHASAVTAGQSNVQIEILSLLTPEQLQTFTTKYSAFLHRPWGGTFGINLSGRQAASVADDLKK